MFFSQMENFMPIKYLPPTLIIGAWGECHNLNLRFTTKARACKGVGQV
jgi:hypothetical protein